MPDELSKMILAETAVSAIETPPRRTFFRRKTAPPLTHCENCGAPLTGRFCGQCGQPAIDYRRSFRHVIVDVLDSFLNWDSKFLSTIGLLLVRPWRLTNEFVAGKRVRHLHPLRLYLLASILFFLVVTLGAKSAHIQAGHADRRDMPPEAKARLQQAEAKIDRALGTGAGKDLTAQVDQAMAKEMDKDVPVTVSGSNDQPLLEITSDKDVHRVRNDRFGKWIEARAKEKVGENGSKAQFFLVSVVNNLPYMMMCAIPLFAFVLKLLYIRKHIYYIDHLIYALHVHAFAYLAIMIIVGFGLGFRRLVQPLWGLALATLIVLSFVQIFLSIRYVYRQGWFMTVFKFGLGGIIYLVVLSIMLAATMVITIMLP